MDVVKLVPAPYVPYQKMYTVLFNAITTALELMEGNEVMQVRWVLMEAQRETEELYIEGGG